MAKSRLSKRRTSKRRTSKIGSKRRSKRRSKIGSKRRSKRHSKIGSKRGSKRRTSKRSSKSKDNFSKEKIILQKSNNPNKKYMVTIGKKTIHFGSSPYKSYEVHKDKARMLRYLNRHRSRENWTKSGIKTAGFWSRWILWNKPSLLASIKDTEKRFNIHIQRKK